MEAKNATNMLSPRKTYAPFEYPEAYDFWTAQQTNHWHHMELSMADDIHDWKHRMTESERNVVGRTLKGFTITEIFIQDYWSTKVQRWFKKPEIQMMASTFGAWESIHAAAYSNLEESLGIQSYDAFLTEPSAKAKIDRLVETPGKSKKDIAMSLAIFSAFNEGVNLFSSFAILWSFAQRDLLKAVGNIIKWSVRDESLHSTAGCWLFRQFIQENPEIFTDDMKEQIMESARVTVKLEDEFIDQAFGDNPLPNLDPKDLKNYIRFRCNTKLGDLGMPSNWRNIDRDALSRLEWFSVLSSGAENNDFFASKVTSYALNTVNFDNVYGD